MSTAMTDGAMGVMDELAKLIEACAGYRARCIAAGFTVDTAEQMAVQLHANLMLEMDRRSVAEWTVQHEGELLRCDWCGQPFERPADRGPTPRFCKPACRQSAHRARHSDGDD